MKKKILPLLVTQLLFSPFVLADMPSNDDPNAPKKHPLLDFGGQVGAFAEYKTKTVSTPGINKELKETYKENTIFDSSYYFKQLPIYGAFKVAQVDTDLEDHRYGYFEKKDGWKIEFETNYRYDLPNGFNTGIGYTVEYTTEDAKSNYDQSIDLSNDENTLKTFLGYWNDEFKGGFYSELGYKFGKSRYKDSGYSSKNEMDGYKFLIKPYKNFGNFFIGTEFYLEDTTTDNYGLGQYTGKSETRELYIEPELAYSFDFGGRVFLKQRFTRKDTEEFSAQGVKGNEYYSNISKTTLGYGQNIGDSWRVATEIELETDDKDRNDVRFEEMDSTKFKLMAHYRF